MKILAKLTILILLLLLGGCAHYGRHSSGYVGGAYGVNISRHIPYDSYSLYYDHDYYLHKPHHDKHYYDNDKHYRHYSRPYVNKKHSQHKSFNKHKYYANRGKRDRYYSGSRHPHDIHYGNSYNRKFRPGNRNRGRNDKNSRRGFGRAR